LACRTNNAEGIQIGHISRPESVSNRVEQTLELNAAASGTVTRKFIEELIQTTFQTSSCSTSINEAPTLQNTLCTPFLWDSSFHLLPKNYKIPRLDAMSGWVVWNLGIPEDRLPPFRKITSKDFSDTNSRKEFSCWNVLYSLIEETLQDNGKYIQNASLQDVQAMFLEAQVLLPNILKFSSKSKGKRSREQQWTVSTVVKKLRSQRRQAKAIS
jgi:hypothetical protein